MSFMAVASPHIVKPMFTEEIFLNLHLTLSMEKKNMKYIQSRIIGNEEEAINIW